MTNKLKNSQIVLYINFLVGYAWLDRISKNNSNLNCNCVSQLQQNNSNRNKKCVAVLSWILAKINPLMSGVVPLHVCIQNHGMNGHDDNFEPCFEFVERKWLKIENLSIDRVLCFHYFPEVSPEFPKVTQIWTTSVWLPCHKI